LSAPYPSSNEPSVLPALPSDYPLIHQLQTNFRLEDYRYDSSDAKSSKSSIDHQDFMPMPMPMLTNNQQQPINLHHSNNIVENQHMMPSNGRPSKPDVIPSNNDLFSTPKF
jgi:hypothetical protein